MHARLTLGVLAIAVLGLSACAQVRSEATVPESAPSISSLPQYDLTGANGTISRDASLDTERPHRSDTSVVRYTVQPGDSVFGVAEKFGLLPETILWGNLDSLSDDPHALQAGDELNVLPVDGVYYQWKAGDKLEAVAEAFGVTSDAILDWPGNDLSPIAAEIGPGEWLVVPGGQREFQTWHIPTIPRGSAGVGNVFGAGGCQQAIQGGAVGTGGLVWPTANQAISGNDYWSGHLAIDLAAGLGDPVWAADGGAVVFAGWAYGGYGTSVAIDHGNGWQSVYAHLSAVQVECGEDVTQAQPIGLAGSTGNSSGPHLHFELRFEGGFVNPWYVLP
jgi:LysM repeat protein